MRSSAAARFSKLLSTFFAVALCCGIIPSAAFAAQTSPSLIPEGDRGAARVPSGAEGGAPDSFSHCDDEGAPSAGAGSAASTSENDSYTTIDRDLIYSAIHALGAVLGADSGATDDSADFGEGDADSTASPFEPADQPAGEPIENATLAEQQGRAVFTGDLPSYLVRFDSNGGVGAPDSAWTTGEGLMPSILNQHVASKVPARDKYVFMGFYDGSDYRQATRYYNPDFTQDGCATQGLGEHGLVLYAGWAPVISVDVPAAVSVSVGTLSDVDAPTKTTATIKNMSPWDVKATSLTWDETELEGSTASLDGMFSNPGSLRFSLSLTDDPSQEALVAPGGTTAQPSEIGFIALPAGSTMAPSEKSFDYTMLMNDATVEVAEAVSSTALVTVFEAADAPVEDVRASALFDINDDGASDYYLDAQEYVVGQEPPALRMPDGSDFRAPEYYGHTFMGFYDNPVYDAEGAVQYFDENGQPVRDWDRASATVLYAGWSTEKGRVVFDGNGGHFDGDASKTVLVYEVEYGSAVSSALGDGFVPTAMFRSGSGYVTSDEWYTDPIGGVRNDDFSQVVMEDVDEAMTFYAHWSATDATVPVTFMANGKNALVEGELSVTKDIKLGEFMGSLPEAARPGFSFAGWWTAATGGIKIESAPPTLAPMTLYAHWTGDEVTVNWDNGGWDVADPPSATYTYTDDDTINTGYPSGGAYDAMDRGSGFKWNGWYAKTADGLPSGDKITAASPLPIASTTYHAFWDVELAWSLNDGTDAAEKTSVTLSDSMPVAMPGSDPVREGYAFLGWFTAASGGEKVTSETVVAGPQTFCAHWANEFVSIRWDAHDGSEIAEERYRVGDALVLPVEPSCEGYTFAGWWAAEEGGSQVVSGALAPASDATYHARWTPNTYTITYQMKGHGTAPTDDKYTYGAAKALPSPAAVTGYTFGGWFIDDACTKAASITATTSGDLTVYAKWTVNTYAITWNVNGHGTAPTKTSYTYGEAYTLPALSANGYTWGGWYTNSGLTTAATSVTATTTGDKTFYAKWTPISYSIGYALGGGANNSSNPTSYTIETSTVTLKDPTRDGHAFIGWTGSNGATPQKNPTIPKGSTGDRSYTANWSIIQYTVSYNLNGGTGIASLSSKVDWGADFAITSAEPTKAGYEFLGWSENGTATAATYAAGGKISSVKADKTLYAVWKKEGEPSASTEAEAGNFYIYNGSSTNGIVGYYTAEDIKKAANDIAANGTNSTYYALYRNLMNAMTDVKMTKSSTVYGYSTGWGDGMSYFFRIIGINHDEKVVGGKAGLTFQFAGMMKSYYTMNSSNTSSGGWGDSALRSSMNSGVIYGYVPAIIKNNWVQVKKYYGPTYSSAAATVSTSNDYLFLASHFEHAGSVWSSWSGYQWVAKEGMQYEYYQSKNIKNDGSNACLVKYQQTSATEYVSSSDRWWERSVYPNRSGYFMRVGANGPPNYGNPANNSGGVVPCFCF